MDVVVAGGGIGEQFAEEAVDLLIAALGCELEGHRVEGIGGLVVHRGDIAGKPAAERMPGQGDMGGRSPRLEVGLGLRKLRRPADDPRAPEPTEHVGNLVRSAIVLKLTTRPGLTPLL